MQLLVAPLGKLLLQLVLKPLSHQLHDSCGWLQLCWPLSCCTTGVKSSAKRYHQTEARAYRTAFTNFFRALAIRIPLVAFDLEPVSASSGFAGAAHH